MGRKKPPQPSVLDGSHLAAGKRWDWLKKLLVRMARQSPALIVAMLALFVALTGTAVATTSALIGSAQIRNNSITGLDVKNRSLRPIDFRGSVRGPRGLRGLTGATGAAGPARPAQGDQDGRPGDRTTAQRRNVAELTGSDPESAPRNPSLSVCVGAASPRHSVADRIPRHVGGGLRSVEVRAGAIRSASSFERTRRMSGERVR